MTSPYTTMVEMRESVASGEHQLKSSSAMSVELYMNQCLIIETVIHKVMTIS